MTLTLVIVLITCGISLLLPREHHLYSRLLFNAYSIKHNKEWYRIFTHAFLHADIFHLIFNMFVLYNFGTLLERSFLANFGEIGYFYYFLLYVGGIVFSTFAALKRHQNNPGYNSLGASGAVSAVLFSFIIFEPMQGVGLIFIPIYAPAIVFGAVYLLAEYLLDKYSQGHIAHDAHLLGGLYGIAFTFAIDYQLFFEMISKIKGGSPE
jgi:membrane associated rhomboid family serine protease